MEWDCGSGIKLFKNDMANEMPKICLNHATPCSLCFTTFRLRKALISKWKDSSPDPISVHISTNRLLGSFQDIGCLMGKLYMGACHLPRDRGICICISCFKSLFTEEGEEGLFLYSPEKEIWLLAFSNPSSTRSFK